MTPAGVVNIALSQIGNQTQIANIFPSDGTPAGDAAALLYTPTIQGLMRSAPWDSLRKQVNLTQLKATVINGVLQTTNLPPTPFQYEYAYPSDCLKARFLVPTQPTNANIVPPLTTGQNQTPNYYGVNTRIPYVVSSDLDANNNPIKVILTNLQNAQLVYSCDLSQYPDLWDPMLLNAATALLGAWLINALARNERQMEAQIQIAKGAIDAARAVNGNESLTKMDHEPDWISVRGAYANAYSAGVLGWGGPGGPGMSGAWTGWDSCGMPGGLFY